MTMEDLDNIQSELGYWFNNPMLLQQAFIRRSFSAENPEYKDNEVLEFIGDAFLQSAVTMFLANKYRLRRNDSFVTNLTEGELTELRKKLVQKKTLAQIIDALELNEYLVMGIGDIKNNVKDDDSVKEDLFEAIVGAAAVDSGYDINAIYNLVITMLAPESLLKNNDKYPEYDNYVGMLQEWCQKKGYPIPFYEFIEVSRGYFKGSYMIPFDNLIFEDEGRSKSLVKQKIASKVLEYLEANNLLITMEDEITDVSHEMVINKLQELAHKGYFSMPIYEFKEIVDNVNNHRWECSCKINEYDTVCLAESNTKKDAKKKAAYLMLKYVFESVNKK